MKKQELTWYEICTKYPNQQVALTDVTWGNGSTVIKAIVKASEKEDNLSPVDIASMAAMSNGTIVSENTSDSILCAGASVIC